VLNVIFLLIFLHGLVGIEHLADHYFEIPVCRADEKLSAPNDSRSESGAPSESSESLAPIFYDMAEKVGLDFVHFNGMSGEYYFPEMTGQGGGFFDYDNDGDIDVYLVHGNMLGPGKTLEDALFPFQGPLPIQDRLFRNDLILEPDGRRVLRFVDITEESGIQSLGYGMGIATGDFDNDGWTDLYVTNYGSNELFRNNGDGTFANVTEEAGADDPRWSTSASFFDYDADGWLDLYVCNYVEVDITENKRCYAPSSARDYCGPSDFPPVPDRLFRNLGNGRFEDVTGKALVSGDYGAGLGVVASDFNGDGRIDIYVANDGMANQLWVNQGNGRFVNDALFAGIAVNWMGRAEASMGVDAGDFDRDGDEDLFMTHLMQETNTLYVNDGTGLFDDQTLNVKLGAPSLSITAFGTGWFDYDNDGWLDIVIAAGAVRVLADRVRAGDPYPLDQRNQLYHNQRDGTFEDVSSRGGEAFEIEEVSRGIAFGDVDNDGDTDILLINNNGPARLLINQFGHQQHWLGLKLLGMGLDRNMLGARIQVVPPEGPPIWRRVRTDGSYCSAHDPRVLVGLGEQGKVSLVRVHWPDGREEEWREIPIDRYTTLREGEGQEKK
jgi:hypothetical protein